MDLWESNKLNIADTFNNNIILCLLKSATYSHTIRIHNMS